MATMYDDEVIRERVIATGPPGDGFDAAAALQMRNDMDTMLARPVVETLTDIPDVVGDPSDGDSIVWDAADDRWETRAVAGNIARVDDRTSTQVEPNVSRLTFEAGLTARRAGAGWAAASVVFAGPGSANSAARSDHVHPNVQVPAMTIPESGSLSSGTRTLVSGNVTGLDPAKTYTIKPIMVLEVQGEGVGAGYSVASVTVGASTATRNESRHVSGVPREITIFHSGHAVTGVTSVTVTARLQYTSGDPVYVRGGRVTVDVEPES